MWIRGRPTASLGKMSQKCSFTLPISQQTKGGKLQKKLGDHPKFDISYQYMGKRAQSIGKTPCQQTKGGKLK
jgi:hypothetical protein